MSYISFLTTRPLLFLLVVSNVRKEMSKDNVVTVTGNVPFSPTGDLSHLVQESS